MRPNSLPPLAMSWQFLNSKEAEQPYEDRWHSRDSSHSTTNSTASSPTTNSHARSSSASSISSNTDQLESSFCSYKKAWPALPDVAEEPTERDGQDDPPTESSPQDTMPSTRWSHDVSGTRPMAYYAYDTAFPVSNGACNDDSDAPRGHWAKRRRSGESALGSMASRIVQRMPSFSRKTRSRERSSSSMSGYKSKSGGFSPVSVSRSSSRAASIVRSPRLCDTDYEKFGPSYPEHSYDHAMVEDSYDMTRDSGIGIALGGEDFEEEEPCQAYNTTPLLHPLMDEIREESPVQSPLQSPTIATTPHSIAVSVANTPVDTPRTTGLTSPPLSAKVSSTSFGRSRAGTLIPSSEIPPITIAEDSEEDRWAAKLGHANFNIQPEPHLARTASIEACKQLFKEWDQARQEYAKHLARTETHFGTGSRVYLLTEEKWLEVDARWKSFYKLSLRMVPQQLDTPPYDMPIEPAPVAKIPLIDENGNDGRFPTAGDNGEIIGPMEVAAPPPVTMIKRKVSKRERVRSLFGSISFPGSILNSK